MQLENKIAVIYGATGAVGSVIARAFAADGIYKVDASVMTSDMAMIAADMLRESGAGDWDFETLTALKMIRASNADIEEMCTPKPAAAAAE
jgi:NAD(P)-dependent dehydrogenase (short-subunit alcohol dehydrogenase family)